MYLDIKAIFTGTQIAYYVVCPTKLWYFSNFIGMEQTSDLVSFGRILQETTFQHLEKDLVIDQKISIDFIKRGKKIILHEIKKSDRLENAHKMQLLYYIYYLKYKKGLNDVEGIINYPLRKKIVKVELTKQQEYKLMEILNKIQNIISQPVPPSPSRKNYCRKCSYFEFCWV